MIRTLIVTLIAIAILAACTPGETAAPAEQSGGSAQEAAQQTAAPAEPTDQSEAATGDATGEPVSGSDQPTAIDTPQPSGEMDIQTEDVEITSEGQRYPSYLAAPASGGPYPGIVLIHSINGLEEGYRTMTDRFAAQGFVVLAIGWQTFERQPPDAVVQQLVADSAAYLSGRGDVDPARLGLTGFCAGGRYTMLLLPQMSEFGAGVAWYGFPYSGETQPASVIAGLGAPMLIIHGTGDTASPIEEIYEYAMALHDSGKSFEMKIYSGEPHGFMLSDGQMREDDITADAFDEMVRYFRRKLN